jgi:hypothetical protein
LGGLAALAPFESLHRFGCTHLQRLQLDDEGRAVRVAQWLVELEAPVDVTALTLR